MNRNPIRTVDAVGYQAAAQGSSAAGGEQDEVPNVVLNQMIDLINPTGIMANGGNCCLPGPAHSVFYKVLESTRRYK